MKLIQIFFLATCFLNSLSAQSFFNYPINVIDLDILETDNTCFQGFNQEQIDMLFLIDVFIQKFELSKDFKLVGIIGEEGSEGIFISMDSMFYSIINSTDFNLKKKIESRFLFMKHHRTGQFQLAQYKEGFKSGYVIDVYNDKLRIEQWKNNLPYGTQRQFDVVTGKFNSQEARIVPIVDGQPAMFSDTFNTVDLATYVENFYITERDDSTSIIIKN